MLMLQYVHACTGSAAARHILYTLWLCSLHTECRVQSAERDPKIPRNLNFHPIIATAIYRVVLHETDTPYFTVNNIPT